VLSFDAVTRTLVPAQVMRSVVRQDARRFVRINQALLATDNHPFFTENGWVRAEELQIGAALVALNELEVRLASVDQLALEVGTGPTYNLHVEGQHNYFAGGMLVHDRP
jgi:intein/homing endonuclease